MARVLSASGTRLGASSARDSSGGERGRLHIGRTDWSGDAPSAASVSRGHAATDLDVTQCFVQRIFGVGRAFHAEYVQCASASRRRRVADVPVVGTGIANMVALCDQAGTG